MTTRVTREAEQIIEAEPGRSDRPITLHDASLGGHVAAMLPKVNVLAASPGM
jgi:hypothetical protein